MIRQVNNPLRALAVAAGLVPVWQDVFSQTQEVSDDSLRSLLFALGFPCATPAQIQDSHRRVLAAGAPELISAAGRLWVIDVGQILDFPWQGNINSQLVLESGLRIDGATTWREPGVARIAPIYEPGYHHLYLGDCCIALAVCPLRCPAPMLSTGTGTSIGTSTDNGNSKSTSSRDNGNSHRKSNSNSNGARTPAWGIAAQVYSLHGQKSGNRAGDFSVLADFVTRAGHAGASAVAISPVHALFTAAPERYSPYSPSSRLFLNVAYADPSLIDGPDAAALGMNAAAGSTTKTAVATRSDSHVGHTDPTGPALGGQMQDLAKGCIDTINWPVQMHTHLALLRQCFDRFDRSSDHAPARDFRQFCAEGGEALESHARYEALSSIYCQTLGPESGWQDWPAALHDPEGAAAQRFAAEHRNDVDFHCFAQWLADQGLAAAQAAARGSGMSVGLITDLAIGTDARGSHAWSRQREILHDVSVGAPPDVFQPQGQSWGITAFSPHALQRNGYMGFIETLRANLRHAGGIRMDHIMGLARMWLVPKGAQAHEGVYLRYPFQDMLRLLVLEAWRHHAIVIGENLGTVPPDFNSHLQEKGVLGTSVLWFEEQGNWPDWTMATTTTHDLPTIEGWWAARDIRWREQLAHVTAQQADQQRIDRSATKKALLARLPTNDVPPDSAAAPRQAILKYVAATPGPLVIIPVEDIIGLLEQPNLPGTSTAAGAVEPLEQPNLSGTSTAAGAIGPHEPPNLPGTATAAGVNGKGHPSWIQRLPQSVEMLFVDSENQNSLESIRQGRAVAARAASAAATTAISTGSSGEKLDHGSNQGSNQNLNQDPNPS
ncbi:4-alpha-glucanotransferase [Pusillimonas sp. ANT_WB101]|uniref:4-alpha-glucanotransferase n=1 Tax=Pusillimonas sp. ANT_WB101 TaxID=2597356 RepID=UPI0011ED18ED|nr:4-alpha-glucanotransferase [Pusillimonas sp. ANT_WB101]KAA0911051.1 4-alpha-glucanotransferase [Pusillimonas sp. ANT_WB101]